jgi:hypothetical protein
VTNYDADPYHYSFAESEWLAAIAQQVERAGAGSPQGLRMLVLARRVKFDNACRRTGTVAKPPSRWHGGSTPWNMGWLTNFHRTQSSNSAEHRAGSRDRGADCRVRTTGRHVAQRNWIAWPPSQFADRWSSSLCTSYGGGLGCRDVLHGERLRDCLAAHARRAHSDQARLIYPPLWASMALLLAVYVPVLAWSDDPGLRGYALQEVLAQPNPLPNILTAMTLGNYLVGTAPVNGVAWTLIIDVLFYTLVASLLPLLKTRPRTAIPSPGVPALLQVVRGANSVVFAGSHRVSVSYMFLGSRSTRWTARIGTPSSFRRRSGDSFTARATPRCNHLYTLVDYVSRAWFLSPSPRFTKSISRISMFFASAIAVSQSRRIPGFWR